MKLQCASSLSSISMQEQHWFAAYTYPRHEKAVAGVLEQKGIEVFLPVIQRVSQWKDRRVNLEVPLFSSYVFAKIHAGERYRVLAVPSVIRIVSFRGVPVPVSNDEIAAIQLCIRRGAKLQKHCYLAAGDRVYVKRGIFEGMEGIVVRHNNGCRLIVSISLIHQSVALEIDADLLECMAPCPSSISRRLEEQYEIA